MHYAAVLENLFLILNLTTVRNMRIKKWHVILNELATLKMFQIYGYTKVEIIWKNIGKIRKNIILYVGIKLLF